MVDDDNRADGDLEPEPQGGGTSEHSGTRRSTWAAPAATGGESDYVMSDDELADALEEDFERSTHTGTYTIVAPEASEQKLTAEAEPAVEEESGVEPAVDEGSGAEPEPQAEEDTEVGFDPEPVIEFVGSVAEEPVTVYSLDDVVLPQVDEELGGVGNARTDRPDLWEVAAASPEFETTFKPVPVPMPESEPEPAPWPISELEPEVEPEPEPQSETEQLAQPAAETHAEPPVRRSLLTNELAATLAASAESGGDPSKIMAQLEEQLMLREQDAADFRRWQDTVVAERGPGAFADIEAAREGFVDIFESAGPVPSAATVGAPPLATNAFGVDAILDSRLMSAPAPMTAPVSDIPPPPGHTLAPMPMPMPTSATSGPESPFFAEAPVPVPVPVPELQPEPELTFTAPPAIPDLVEPSKSPEMPDPFDFDTLIGGTAASVLDEPTAFATPPAEDRQFSAVAEPSFDSEPSVDETVSDTDRAFADLAGPSPVTSEGVTLLPQPVVGLAPPLSNAQPSSSGFPVIETALVAPRAFRVEESSAEPTLKEQRVGRASRLFWLWFAANSSIVSVAFGGTVLSLGMSLRQAIVATLIGVAVSFLPLGLGTLAGKWSGQPTMVISRASFGHFGNMLPAGLAIIVRVFWGAVLLWFLAAGTARILTGAKLAGPLTETQLVIIGLAIGFLLALVIAFFGYGLIARIQMVFTIISALLIAGLIYLTWPAVDFAAALTLADGPWILVLTGAVLVFSFVGLVWAVSSADLARYQRSSGSGASSMLWSTFGATIPAFVLIAYGAVLAASNPNVATGLITTPLDTISELMPVWYPIPLIAALAFSLLSGVVVSIYSGGFALQATGASMRRSAAVVIVGAAVAALAVLIAVSVGDFTIILRDVATSLAVPIAAWAGIFGAEMMIRNKRFDSQALLKRGGVYGDVRWVNLAMLIVASGVGFGLTTATVSWLGWQGYLFEIMGVPLSTDLAASDMGVFAALVIGLLTPIVAGIPAIRRQEAVAAQRNPSVGAQRGPIAGTQRSPIAGTQRSPIAAD